MSESVESLAAREDSRPTISAAEEIVIQAHNDNRSSEATSTQVVDSERSRSDLRISSSGIQSDVAELPMPAQRNEGGSMADASNTDIPGRHINRRNSEARDKWVHLDAEERMKFNEELEPYTKLISEAEAIMCKERLQSFTEQVVHLIDKLTNVSNAILRIFPYSHIPKSTQDVRIIFLALLFKLRLSASERFMDAIESPDVDNFFNDILKKMKSTGKTVKLKDNKGAIQKSASASLSPPSDTLNAAIMELLELLHENVITFSKDLKTFSDHMNVTSNDEMDEVYETLSLVSVFIKRWAKTNVDRREGGLMTQVYEHDLMLEMDDHVGALCFALNKFLIDGLPEIEEDFKDQEKRTQIESLALLGGGTLFTSITASTLGLSLMQKSTTYDIVNFFWFTSLVFSLGSVMNSLVAFTWKHSIFRKRAKDEQLPMFIAFWSRESPLYFLVISALTFVVGLCMLAYASGQAKWTSTVTTILTGLSILGIVGTTAWFIAEYYKYQKSSDHDASSSNSEFKLRDRLLFQILNRFPFVASNVGRARSASTKLRGYFFSLKNNAWNFIRSARGRRAVSDAAGELEAGPADHAIDVKDDDVLKAEFDDMAHDVEIALVSESSPDSDNVADIPKTPEVMRKLIGAFESVGAKGLELEGNADFEVSEISFSADGKILGIVGPTSCLLYDFPGQAFLHAVEMRSEDEVLKGGIIWSPQCNTFLLRSNRGMQIWRDQGGSNRQFEYYYTMAVPYIDGEDELFAWYPDGEYFCCVNGSSVKKYGIYGTDKPLLEGSLLSGDAEVGSESFIISDVAVIAEKGNSSAPRLLISATIMITIKSTSTARASKSAEHHELIVYDIESRRVESRIPLFGRTWSICLSKNKTSLVIGYAKKPPQLWDVSLGKSLEFTPRHSYRYVTRTKPPRENTEKYWWRDSPRGRSFFYGPGDNLVVCWDYNSDTFQVWDKDTAVPLFYIDSSSDAGSIKSIAVNELHDSLAFASVSFSGKIAIWTMSTKEQGQDNGATNDVEDEDGISIVQRLQTD